MITFKLFQNGLYLSETGISDPSKARVGFLFQDASRPDPTFELSQGTWTDPNQQGYFACFVPSATRDWATFATTVRGLFTQTALSQFGWFAESGANVTAVTLVLVGGQGTSSPFVQSPFSLQFNNVTLTVQASPFVQSSISFNDTSNAFQILNPNQAAVQLIVQPPNQPQQTFSSNSPNLLLPMNDPTDPHVGSVNVAFQLTTQDLAQFEAGFMYFAPGPAQLLTALSYPVLRQPGGAPTPLNFSAWLDVLQPLVDTRSYFQCTDALVGSYFVSTIGQAFALRTVNSDGLQRTSRLAFANRPIHHATDTGTYYLTPAGSFQLTIDTSGSVAAAAPVNANLLCGVTGTEFLHAATSPDAPSADTLDFQTGQPAFRAPAPANEPSDNPKFLDSMNGNVTTAWVQFSTATGSYVSQPEPSPLYLQDGETAAALSGQLPASGLNVYLLNFLPLPTWKPSSEVAAMAGPAQGPLVPMVPYAGLSPTAVLEPYLSMELEALNPTRKNAFTSAQAALPAPARITAAPADELIFAMTPQGLLAGLEGTQQLWTTTQIAVSPSLRPPPADPVTLQFIAMGNQIRQAMQQNQIFIVISTLTDSQGQPLFQFAGPDQTINIAGWPFSLSPAGTPASDHDKTPPILILKFYPGQSIASLVSDISLWSQATVFNGPHYTATQAQTYIAGLIQQACQAVYGRGKCPDGEPSGQPDTNSLYYNFYQVMTDPEFSGLLALNCNMQLNALPAAIRAVTGGMTKPGSDGKPISNIDAFRVHHVGMQINDTAPESQTPTLAQSSLFGLVDYEKPANGAAPSPSGLSVNYNFEVEFLRALFTNSELRNFSCQINLTINNLFGTGVQKQTNVGGSAADEDGSNVVVITGSYQAHSTTGDDQTSGQGVYSFVAEDNFSFTFDSNPYLDHITLTKLQFAFEQETPSSSSAADSGTTTNIQAGFAIWGSMVFKELNVLDIFSFKQLVFADLGISVSFDLTVFPPPQAPTTSNLHLTFSPGDLRFDLAQSTPRESSTSLLSLIPFKLKSFLYSQKADQTIESLQYFSFGSVPLAPGFKLVDRFNYALLFDLDLGSMGGLVGSLSAFKFSILIGWLTEDTTGGIAFGLQLPQADGKLEIKIEGVLNLVIEQFVLKYVSVQGTRTPPDGQSLFVLALHNSYLELLGQRLPHGQALFDFALFAPSNDAQRIGWMAAINNQQSSGSGQPGSIATTTGNGNGGDSGVFQLIYLGGGQRVGPDPASPPTTFQAFLSYMTGDFWTAFKDNAYDKVYHPESNWLVLSDFKLLGMIEVGFVFYDVTPFYSLTLNVENLFNFEITYTKVSDSIGLFYANFTLPDALRTFQVGAASLTLPAIGVSVYTNGNWKLDVGFPNGDDWSRSFGVQAMAGPVPVTGSGGFYIASLSSATSSIFKGNYPSILAFGFAARLGVGKDFTSGPLKAGISVTFFGIIEGAAGYRVASSDEMFKQPDALSLKGQFGLIGEIYGSIDFKIIKASVNVTLQASIGIQLYMERSIPGSGTILLYVQASVKLSISVSIDLGLFSISISFSFNASFRFQWELGGSSAAMELQLAFAARPALVATVWPLCPGLNANVPLWFLPEATVIFPATTGTGVPWFVSSLGIEYDPHPPTQPTYAQFKPFEAVTTQLVTWALGQVLQLSGCSFTVTQAQLDGLDQHPAILVGWIDYPTLLSALASFQAAISVPAQQPGTTSYATVFPMLPFIQLQTNGRLNGSGQPDDLSYQFSSKNLVSENYIQQVDQYFNQLFVNQTQSGGNLEAASPAPTIPLIQEVFVDYFTGLIRGAVHQLLQTMQDGRIQQAALDQLIQTAVGGGQFATLAGQMSSSFRGGARLPFTPGLTIPGGQPLTTTNPLYALLWQEFPVEQLSPISNPNGGPTAQYTIAITNPDLTQTWVTSTVNWALTTTWLQPYQQVQATDIQGPTPPVQLPFTNTGPQSFSFENAMVWTQPQDVQISLRPFPSNLQQLESVVAGDIAVLVQSRQTGAPYLPGGTLLPPNTFTWATLVQLTIKQVPAATGGQSLPDMYALSGASQQDQALLEQILRGLETEDPIAAIQVLYQTSAGATGLSSGPVNPADVFVLRTNTTTVSAPPSGPNLVFRAALSEPPEVAVGAQIDQHVGFLQIIQQAAVTNAPGYYLRYIDTTGQSLPTALFSAGPAPLTLLITYVPDGSQNTKASPARVRPFYNTIALSAAQAGLLYYATTTDPSLDTQYSAVAAGSVGVSLTRDDSAMLLRPSAALAATCGADAQRGHTRADLVKFLVEASVTDETHVRALLADSGSAAAQLNALYSLITYQVAQTTGFIQSHLSAPIQPQQPNGSSSHAASTANTGDGTRSYRVFVPLYNLADANQPLPPNQPPNRYASIADPFSIGFFQNDAFGNQLPTQLNFGATNLYFDPIIPLDQWQGVVTAYDFLAGASPQPHSFTVYLRPSPMAFTQMSLDQAAAARQAYTTIYDQITGPGVSFYIETNLALQTDETMVQVTLTQDQTADIVHMVSDIVTYLKNFVEPPPPFTVQPVPLTVTATGAGTLPPVFEMAVLFGVQRDANLISPLLKDHFGNITFPSAQNVSSTIPSTVGASLPTGGSVEITTFAANFVKAFPALALSVGLNGAQPPQQRSSTGRTRMYLKAASMPGDGSGPGRPGPQSLWAVQQVLLDVTIGVGASSGPFYLSPKPLDNTLNTAVVPLPPLPQAIAPTNWPSQQLFTDVDLDQLNRTFFQAVDNMLAPASAAKAFEVAREAYTNVAYGRTSLAQQYAVHEVDWLFSPQSPFTGTNAQLAAARETFAQQMRAALMTAYSVDTLVQYSVTWNSPVPASVGDLLSLYGEVQPTGDTPLPQGYGLSTAQVPVTSNAPGLLTFLFGTAAVQNLASVELDLQYNITHLQYFLEPSNQVQPGEARPSMWLQLVNPYPAGPPHIGPKTTSTVIPLVFRQYPTPPTVINQQGLAGASSTPLAVGDNPLTTAAAWHCLYQYQVQLTDHDQIVSSITYNTDMSASPRSQQHQTATAADPNQAFSLFQALARFSATYPVLLPFLTDLADTSSNWALAAAAFSSLVTEVVTNTTWNPPPMAAVGGPLRNITDQYVITDKRQNGSQIITLTWDPQQGESSFGGVTLSTEALTPSLQPYPNQVTGTVPNGITDTYVPVPALEDNWVVHQVEVDSLNVLAAENALAGVQVERNLIEMTSRDGTQWLAQDEFVYMTPIVRATQPVTPFIDNSTPINIAQLPNQGISTGCPQAPPPPGLPSLCQRIYTMMYDLLSDPDLLSRLAGARLSAGLDDSAQRRVKVACSFQYPIAAATGGSGGLNPISPLFPVVLARSFLIDGAQTDQLNDFSGLYAHAIATWSFNNNIMFGAAAQPVGAQFVFDITLYAQLSGLNTPVLRLRNLQLKLTDIAVS